MDASGGGVLLLTGSVFHSTVTWPLSAEDCPCSLLSFLLRPCRRSFVVVLFLYLRSIVIWSRCIGVVVIWRLW